MGNNDAIKLYEQKLKDAKTLDELNAVWKEIDTQINDGQKTQLYRLKEKREFELKYQQFKALKEELSRKKKKLQKERVDIKVHIVKKWANSHLFTAEHYVLMLNRTSDVQTAVLKKVKLVEREGYLMLESKDKNWVLNSEPLLLMRPKFPFGKKYVAVYFVLPNHPYTLSLRLDDKLKDLVVQQISGTHIVHALVKTRFFEALARVGSGFDLMTLLVGIMAGLGMGMAIGFGASYFHLTNLLVHHATNSTAMSATHTTSTTTYVIPPSSGGKSG